MDIIAYHNFPLLTVVRLIMLRRILAYVLSYDQSWMDSSKREIILRPNSYSLAQVNSSTNLPGLNLDRRTCRSSCLMCTVFGHKFCLYLFFSGIVHRICKFFKFHKQYTRITLCHALQAALLSTSKAPASSRFD